MRQSRFASEEAPIWTPRRFRERKKSPLWYSIGRDHGLFLVRPERFELPTF